MALWERLESGEVSKQIAEFYTRPQSGAYGPIVRYDNRKYRATEDLVSNGMSKSEADTEVTALTTRGSTPTFSLVGGGSATGFVESVRTQRIRGTTLFQVTVRLLRTDL